MKGLADLLQDKENCDQLIFLEADEDAEEESEDWTLAQLKEAIIKDEIECMVEEEEKINKFERTDEGEKTDMETKKTEESEAMYVTSRKGSKILLYNNYRYRKAYNTKQGSRWSCSMNKECTAFVFVNDNHEIIWRNEEHCHEAAKNMTAADGETAVVITSRKGKEMLLYHQYTYRKQYEKMNRCRWVCSTLKNCRAAVFTDLKNCITSVCDEHCHDPPKYYLQPHHVLEALKEPVILEAD